MAAAVAVAVAVGEAALTTQLRCRAYTAVERELLRENTVCILIRSDVRPLRQD